MARKVYGALDISDNELLNALLQNLPSDPSSLESKIYYNTTLHEIRYHDGSSWKSLGVSGTGGPPSGTASGDLTGTYPGPQIAALAVTDAKVAAANKDGLAAVPSMRTLGVGSTQAAAGNDPRFTDARTPTGNAGGDLTGTYPNPGIAAGVIIDADINASANIAQSKISGLGTSLSGKVDTTRILTAGAGLSGGGTLASDRSFDVGAGTGILVAADSVAVDTAVIQARSEKAAANGYPSLDASIKIPIAQVPTGTSASTVALGNHNHDTAYPPQSRLLTAAAGLTGGGDLSADRSFQVGAGTGIVVNADDVALDLTYADARYLNSSGDTMTGALTLSADPTLALHAATKQYVDLMSQGFSGKNAVRAVAVTNITQSGTQTIDGVAVAAGNRVLCAGQTTASQNGIWVVAAGAWTRAVDMDASGELQDGTTVPVAEGTTWGDSVFICTSTTASPWVPGTTGSTWTRQSGLADLVAGAGMTKTGNQIDVASATADLTVNADSLTVNSAPKWTTGRTIALTGDVTGTSTAFDGSGNLSFATAIGAGVIVNADVNASAAIDQSKIANLSTDLAAKVPTTRNVIAGNGLTGGGALTGDVTLNFVGDANLSVQADVVSVLSAPKWTTPRTISLTGDVTGFTSMDGSGNVTIATTGGGKRYAAALTASTSQVVNHNLNTQDVCVSVYNSNSPYEEPIVEIEHTSANSVTIKANPALPTGMRVVVLA